MVDIITEADVAKIVEEGQSYLDGEDYASAVDHFAKALEEVVPKYGEVHDVLGKLYLCYGQALLGFARDEADVVIENMVPRTQNGTEQEEESSGATDSTEDKNKDNAKASDENKDEEKEEVENEKKEAEGEGDGDGEGEGDADGEGEGDADGEGEGDGEENENVDNLQLAWEVLEISRKIFTAQEGEGKDLLVDTLYYLGDVSIENENFESAVDDLKQCMKLHEEIKGKPRRLADIHFKLALAYSMGNQFDEAIANFNSAATLLKDRMKVLQDGTSSEEVEKEIAEIKELLPEIENKITDVRSFKEEAHRSLVELLKERAADDGGEQSSSSNTKASPAKNASPVKNGAANVAVNDISHLVRRNKRPSEENLSEASTPTKKAALEKTQ